MNHLRAREIAKARVMIEDAMSVLIDAAAAEQSEGGDLAAPLFDAVKACERAVQRCKASDGGKPEGNHADHG